MHLPQLLAYFESSPALRLLRCANAPFIIDFLDQQFKRPRRIAVGHSELHPALLAYREAIQETYPTALRDRPEVYLTGWCSSNTRWLNRFLESGHDEPLYQLTPHTEDVFVFLDRALGRDHGFVGTESRLRLVIETLADLVVGASADPQTRLDHLRAQKQQIDEEIRLIEGTGAVSRYQPAQVRERFATAVSLLKQLQGDFRAVEEKFRAITRQVQQRHNEGRDSTGGILAFALDAEDLLQREDQGVSFHEFVRFLLSPAQQDRLGTVIAQLGQIEELAESTDDLETVRQMVPLLLAEAEKVMRTNQRLSATLRRLLDGGRYRDSQRVGQLCREILALAASRADDPPPDSVGVEVETRAAIASPFARTFWSEPPRFTVVDAAPREDDTEHRGEAFRLLAQMRRLDWRRMRDNVKSAVARHGTLTLGDLLAEFPVRAGVIEVLGYVQIGHDDGHIVSPAAEEEIVLSSQGAERALALTVPLVRFIAS
jgi:hypothetical protein